MATTAVKTKTQPQIITTISDENVLAKSSVQSTTWYKRIREIRKDPTVRLARALARAPIVASQWSVEMKDGANAEARDLIEATMIPLRLMLLDTATAGGLDFGWQPYEMVLGQDAKLGKTVVTKLKPLLHDITSVKLDKKTGAYLGLRNEGATKIDLKAEETLVITIDKEGDDYYGQSTVDCANKAQVAWESTERGADRYARRVAGAHWVVHYPDGATMIAGDSEPTANDVIATRLLSTLEASGSIAVPKGTQGLVDSLNKDDTLWKIELLADSTGTTPFIERARYLDVLKVRAFELPERAVLEGEFGTKAEATVHADLAIINMELKHQRIVQTLNWHVVNRLLQINYGDETVGTVYIMPQPIADVERAWLREVYKAILGNDTGFMAELENVDLEALRDKVVIPSKSNTADVKGSAASTEGEDT